MSAAAVASTVVQVGGGLLLAPLLPGLVQHWKARLQGRRGPTPLQPYRELRRLWGKSTVEVEGATAVYRLAPAVAVAGVAAAVLLVSAATYIALTWGDESTDDAQIDADVVSVPARIAAVVTELHFEDNQEVKAGQLLVQLDDAMAETKKRILAIEGARLGDEPDLFG